MSRLPETGPSLRRYLEQQKRLANRAGDASPFTRSGSGVTAVDEVTYEGVLKVLGQMVVDGTLTVNGPLTVTQTADITGTTHIGGATDIDGTLNVDAAATFGGAVAVTGTLSLPAGIIDNAALAHPVVPASFYAAASNFAVPNAWTTVVEHSLTTPAGFSQAIVIATAWARIQNTSGAVASSYGTLASINGVAGPWDDDRAIPINYFGNLQATYATLVSGLTEGETIPILTRVFSSPALSADPDNEATINGVVLWLR